MKGDLFNMETFSPQEVEVKENKVEPIKVASKTFPMIKVFLWMGLGLLITGIVSLGLPNLLALIPAETSFTTYVVLMVISSLVMFPCVIVVNIKSFKPKSIGIKIAYILYSIAVGVILSSVFMTLLASQGTQSIMTISTAFLISAFCFLVVGLVGALTKKDLSILYPVLSALLLGALIISLVNYFLGVELVYWIVDFVILGIILVISAVDINRVKKLAEAKMLDDNQNSLAIYCAFNLYVDFINIFIRVLYYLVIFSRRN